MSTVILKLNATGDVVRTTPLLRVLEGPVTWVTAERNLPLLNGVDHRLRVVSWEEREAILDGAYTLAINLEDDREVAEFASRIVCERRFGAILDDSGVVNYTEDSKAWFDLSLISRFGRGRADQLKLANRRSYQELLFTGLGFRFRGEEYLLPKPVETSLAGDVAIAVESGPVWPMKQWAYYDELRRKLEASGLVVNYLPRRDGLLQHLGDIANHSIVVSGDSLPMHLALGLQKRTSAIFNCTSPWEIYDYGLLTKMISPRMDEFFYSREFDVAATRAVSLEAVLSSVIESLEIIKN